MSLEEKDVVRKADGTIGTVRYCAEDSALFIPYDRETWPLTSEEHDELLKENELYAVKPYILSEELCRRVFRYEIQLQEAAPEDNIPSNFEPEWDCDFTAKELLEVLNTMLDRTVLMRDYLVWLSAFRQFAVKKYGSETAVYTAPLRMNETSALRYVCQVLLEDLNSLTDEYEDIYDEEDELLPENLLEELSVLDVLCEETEKPLKERDNIAGLLRWFVGSYGEEDFDELDEEGKSEYRFCQEKLAETDTWVLQTLGYMIYTGNALYEQDWPRCRDIFEAYYAKTGDPYACNTLGYIYYYGRCTHGEPEYEKAFRCFSIGNAAGIDESTYKLADMFLHGYGAARNPNTARKLYQRVYQKTRREFISGDMTSKFADAALRMGNYYRRETKADSWAAYGYYLEADYAIRQRIRTEDDYGDVSVFSGIQKSLAELQEILPLKKDVLVAPFPELLKNACENNRRVRVRIKEEEEGILCLKFSLLHLADEPGQYSPHILVTEPTLGYCELVSGFELRTAPHASYRLGSFMDSFVYNRVCLNEEQECLEFYYDDVKTAEITTEYYLFRAPEKEREPDGASYYVVSIRFQKDGRTYDYLSDDETIKAGDHVLVKGYEGETEVEVIGAQYRTERELFLPVHKYKKIIRKV